MHRAKLGSIAAVHGGRENRFVADANDGQARAVDVGEIAMPEYLHPGVYIEETERGPKPIEGVPTSTAAFIGEAERGPTNPRLVTSYKDYVRGFGGVFGDTRFMPYAVSGFFENGGERMYVCRVTDDAAAPRPPSAQTSLFALWVRADGASVCT